MDINCYSRIIAKYIHIVGQFVCLIVLEITYLVINYRTCEGMIFEASYLKAIFFL